MRFLTVVGVLAVAGFTSLYALATFVTPHTREMSVTIPAQRLRPQPLEASSKNPQTAGADAAVEAPAPR